MLACRLSLLLLLLLQGRRSRYRGRGLASHCLPRLLRLWRLRCLPRMPGLVPGPLTPGTPAGRMACVAFQVREL